MTEEERNDIQDKIVKGAALAFERLVEQKKKEDGELVFGKDGKIVVVKARNLPGAAYKHELQGSKI